MARLLGVNGQQLELELNRTYSIGRGLDCDIAIADMASSRHHARLTTGSAPDAILIEDLDSRNGTYVDELRLTRRCPLLDLNRIRIGATLFLLRLGDGPMPIEDQLDTGTIALEALTLGADVDENVLRVAAQNGHASTEIAGQLSSFTCIDVLQLLIQTHRTGTLHVATGENEAQVHLHDGDVIHAVYKDLEGFPALAALVGESEGIFWLVEHMPDVRRTITDSSSIVLFELCQAMDDSVM
jgi:pSer/pThr/pTyr-binding forkhead associated (FHA) protein